MKIQRQRIVARLILIAFAICLAGSKTVAQTMVDPSLFQQPRQEKYSLDDGDTLGVFVEGVIGEFRSMPPVHQPVAGSDLPPAMGFPTLVLHDGTIRMPLVEPISVRGLTVLQVESLLKKTYREGKNPIITDRNRVIVSLIRKRTVNVMVVRGDQSDSMARPGLRTNQSSPVSARTDGSGRIYNLNLPAGDNDLLNAMMQSGGLPGVNAEEQMQVLRNVANAKVGNRRAPFPRTGDRVGHPESDRGHSQYFPLRSDANFPSEPFTRTQTRLGDGDIVAISGKPTEVFYTGGQLGGGEFVIPRDRPMSVMEAIAQAGGIPQSRRGLGAIPLQEPRLLTLVRNVGGQQISWQFDLGNGFSQQASQTHVRSGDYLILDYSPPQRVKNVGIGVFNTYGVRELFRD
ncbi:polysaccharide biosynthesis/export family protein [Mariniblastus fucicola]|uniref:Polysaccharide biosynthesis/export protein n=1 Tax=Mariniblastus fucicola TaxID=980251 RepID=A0A5B9P9I0_9BACT|nr:polysaccharide biosynthesis/export family protein [Mariniblastus fucicola]QEG22968.1 Polysaccharide biosynthesis/export protein [Mariniblastus fucicola]